MKVIRLERAVTSQAILALTSGEVGAIRISGFVPNQVCDEIGERMLGSALHGNYQNAPLIGRTGQAFFESGSDTAAAFAYLDQATAWIATMRKECAPYMMPMDKFRLQLDEVWPGSAKVARLAGRPMFVGLIRGFKAGSGAEPHQDHLEWDAQAAGIEDCIHLEAQLAANVYLRVPPIGGELVIWPRSLSRAEYEAARVPGSYGVREELLEGAPLVLKPEKGELIVFNSRNTHKVCDSEGGDRLASSNFIGFNGLERPLTLWS